jgi:hypothetical protein
VRTLVTIVGLGAAVAGCATGGASTPRLVAAQDLPKLAGGWQGNASGPTGGGMPATLTIKPDGTYEMRVGAFSSTGVLEARDGRLTTRSTSTTGVPQSTRVSEAVLVERADRWVLTGYGQSDRGPFSYEMSRPK